MDMVAGLEHLGRGTASAVDIMYVVVEPGARSLRIAGDIVQLARDLSIPRLWVVANKVRRESDMEQIRSRLGDTPIVGWLPSDDRVVDADLAARAVYDAAPELAARVRDMALVSGALRAE